MDSSGTALKTTVLPEWDFCREAAGFGNARSLSLSLSRIVLAKIARLSAPSERPQTSVMKEWETGECALGWVVQ